MRTIPFFILVFSMQYNQPLRSQDTAHNMPQKYISDSLQADFKKEKVIGFAMSNLYHGKPQSLLGNFVCDAILFESENILQEHVDAVILPYASLRSFIPKGDVTEEQILRICPFPDTLIGYKITGSDLIKTADAIAKKGGAPVAGISFKIDNMAASDIRIKEEPIDAGGWYNLLTVKNSFIDNNLHKSIKKVEYNDLKIIVNQLVIKYIVYLSKVGKPITVPYGQRIHYDYIIKKAEKSVNQ